MPADRYLRVGAATPVIYPGSLDALLEAMNDAACVSVRLPGRHRLYSRRGDQTSLLQVYENGQCTWLYRSGS